MWLIQAALEFLRTVLDLFNLYCNYQYIRIWKFVVIIMNIIILESRICSGIWNMILFISVQKTNAGWLVNQRDVRMPSLLQLWKACVHLDPTYIIPGRKALKKVESKYKTHKEEAMSKVRKVSAVYFHEHGLIPGCHNIMEKAKPAHCSWRGRNIPSNEHIHWKQSWTKY